MQDLTITLLQTDLFWEDKEANLQMLEQKISAIDVNTELVILPEMFSTGFSMQAAALAESMNGPTVKWMRRTSATKGVIIAGSFIAEEGGRYYNRLVWMLPNGQYGCYDKRHCFSLAGEERYYTAGNKRLIASVNGWKVNLCICYDLRFPVWSRQLSGLEMGEKPYPEYDLLVYVANWPEKRNRAWKTLLPARAIENQCYVAGVNRTGPDGHGTAHSGDSVVLNPLGEELASAGTTEQSITVTLNRKYLEETREKLPFWKDADRFMIL